jgi:hypothetical protein
MRGNAVRQLQERPKPGQLAAAIQRDVAPAFSTGNYRTHRNHQDIEQAMPDLTGTARVLDRTQILRQVFDRHAPFLRYREDTASRISTGQASKISCVAPAADSLMLTLDRGGREPLTGRSGNHP